jgi:hypothetical protein
MSKTDLSFNAKACREMIIRQIEKQRGKGCVDGVLFSPCVNCEDYSTLTSTIYVSATHVTGFGSGVSWKTYGSGDTVFKARK